MIPSLKQAVIEFTKKSNVLNFFLSTNNGGHPGVNVFTVVITRVNATSFKRKINKINHFFLEAKRLYTLPYKFYVCIDEYRSSYPLNI